MNHLPPDNPDEPKEPASPSSPPPEKRKLPRGRAGRKNLSDPFTPTRPGNVRPTPDDIALLRLVEAHRLIDSRQLECALRGDGNARHFLERLKELFNDEYLHRPPAQKRPGATRRPMIYALGIRGRELLDELDQVVRLGKRDWRNENKRLKVQTLDHEIAVTETVLALHFAADQRGWDFRWWRDPRYITDGVLPPRVAIAPEHGRFDALPLRPDAYVVITRDDGHQVNLFVEVDRGTEAQRRIAEKLLAYWSFIMAATKEHGTRAQSWRVLFVTTSEERAQNMRRTAQEDVDPKKKGTHAFLLTTLDRCRIDVDRSHAVFDEPLWWSTKVAYDNPRKLFLDTCPKCHQLIDTSNEPHEILNSDPRLVLAPASTPLPDLLPTDAPLYAHTECPGLLRIGKGSVSESMSLDR